MRVEGLGFREDPSARAVEEARGRGLTKREKDQPSFNKLNQKGMSKIVFFEMIQAHRGVDGPLHARGLRLSVGETLVTCQRQTVRS